MILIHNFDDLEITSLWIRHSKVKHVDLYEYYFCLACSHSCITM